MPGLKHASNRCDSASHPCLSRKERAWSLERAMPSVARNHRGRRLIHDDWRHWTFKSRVRACHTTVHPSDTKGIAWKHAKGQKLVPKGASSWFLPRASEMESRGRSQGRHSPSRSPRLRGDRFPFTMEGTGTAPVVKTAGHQAILPV